MVFNISGGGGQTLNFKMVGALTQPDSATENTIWVKTDVAINAWSIAEDAPSEPAGGMVWVKARSDGSVSFNTLRKNAIIVFLSSAQQYIGGQWKNVEAHAYIGGTWVQFSWTRVSLYNNGVWNTSLTGEWIAQGKLLSSKSNPALTPHVTKNADNFNVYYNSSDNGSGIYYASKKINLTNFKTLHFEGNMSYYSDSYETVGLNVWTNIGNTVVQNRSAALLGNAFASGVRALDVSALTGDYYIGFNVYANRGVGTSSVICKNLYLS